VADLYLACGCALGLPAATRTFVSKHLGAVPRYLAHIDPSAWLAEEVSQELAAKLLVARPPDPPRIASYGGRGPLDSWVAVAAQRAALSLLRRRDPGAAAARASSLEGALSVGLDPELGLARAEVKHHFEGALQVALAGLDARDRMLLRLSLVSGLSCQKIGKIYGVQRQHRRPLAGPRPRPAAVGHAAPPEADPRPGPRRAGFTAGPGPQPDRAEPLGNAQSGLTCGPA
jgi:RNA polymerase sigma-70 factor (ECF subfamily)